MFYTAKERWTRSGGPINKFGEHDFVKSSHNTPVGVFAGGSAENARLVNDVQIHPNKKPTGYAVRSYLFRISLCRLAFSVAACLLTHISFCVYPSMFISCSSCWVINSKTIARLDSSMAEAISWSAHLGVSCMWHQRCCDYRQMLRSRFSLYKTQGPPISAALELDFPLQYFKIVLK